MHYIKAAGMSTVDPLLYFAARLEKREPLGLDFNSLAGFWIATFVASIGFYF